MPFTSFHTPGDFIVPELKCERLFWLSINISRGCLSELAGRSPRCKKRKGSVKEAAEQDKWEGSGRWLQIWKGERKNEGALSAGDVSVLSLPPRLVVLELGSLYNLQRAFQPIYAHFLTTSTALFFLLLSEFL